jgi:hypothetical protein
MAQILNQQKWSKIVRVIRCRKAALAKPETFLTLMEGLGRFRCGMLRQAVENPS